MLNKVFCCTSLGHIPGEENKPLTAFLIFLNHGVPTRETRVLQVC